MAEKTLEISTPHSSGRPFSITTGSTPWFTIWQDALTAATDPDDPFTADTLDVTIGAPGASALSIELRVRIDALGANTITTAAQGVLYGFISNRRDPKAQTLLEPDATIVASADDAVHSGSWCELFNRPSDSSLINFGTAIQIHDDGGARDISYTKAFVVDPTGCSLFRFRPSVALVPSGGAPTSLVEMRLLL